MARKAAKPVTADKEVMLEKLLRQFEESFDQTMEERARSEMCRDYYDGNQWSDEEIRVLRERKQPVVTSNRIKPKIDSLLGFEKRGRTDPKAYPRTPKHDKDAEGATDAIRFVCDQNRFQQIKSDAAENIMVEGIGAATVTVKPAKDGGYDVKLTHVPWDRYYRDPHSRRRDFSDAKYQGVVLWMDEDDALSDFEGKDEVIQGAYNTASEGAETFDDRPKFQWSDSRRKRIRVLQHRWLEKGVWHTAILCRGGFLRDPQVSPYLDENGDPECDLIAASAYVTRENERYGVAQQHISAQDEINKRRSKALHKLSVNQVIAEDGAVESVPKARAELAKPDGYIVVRPDARFEVVNNLASMAGELELLREAKNEIDASGVNPALEGNSSGPSGRAQEITQAAALAEQSVVFDSLRDWSLRVYRSIWCRVRQYWTEEKWVRVTDDENNMRWVALNKPVTAIEEFERLKQEAQQMMAQGQQPPPPPPELIQALQANPQAVIRKDGDLAAMDVDILVEDGPDSVTIQSEQFEELVKLKQADPQSIPTEMVIEASSLRNKERVLEHLKGQGVPPELQQKMQEMEKALQEAQQKLQEAEGSSQDKQADYKLREMELGIKQYEAVTARISALTPAPITDIPDGWQGDASTPQVPDQQQMPMQAPMPMQPPQMMQPPMQPPMDAMQGMDPMDPLPPQMAPQPY